MALSGADHLQGGLEAVPQVPVRYQVIAVLSNVAQSSCESPEVRYIQNVWLSQCWLSQFPDVYSINIVRKVN